MERKGVRRIGCKTFDRGSMERFANSSGDHNPIHMDAVAARRTQIGGPIVHGVHLLLWGLDCVAREEVALPLPTRLAVQFRKPIYVGEEASAELLQLSSERLRVGIVVEGAVAAVISASFGGCQRGPVREEARFVPMTLPALPSDLTLDEMEGRSGCLPGHEQASEMDVMFPSVVNWFGRDRIFALGRSSTVVGMMVPGLRSLFAGIDVALIDDVVGDRGTLQFSVVSVDLRFRLVRIAIQGGGVRGFLEALSWLPPVSQPSMERVTQLVGRDEFRGSRALVVGGSRGLGEITAKIVAAGGARVTITYASGMADAIELVREIRSGGADCEAASYNVLRPAAEQLSVLMESAPTHLYYFATPMIGRRKASLCDPRRLAELNAFYISGFFDLVSTCTSLMPQTITAFVPSSVFVEARPDNMTEYAMSKAAAEILCNDMSRYMPRVRVLTRRLPRMLTDQTNSGMQDMIDPMEVILPIVREMHSCML